MSPSPSSSSYKGNALNLNMLKNKVKIVDRESDTRGYYNNFLNSNSTNNLNSVKYTPYRDKERKSGSLVEHTSRSNNSSISNMAVSQVNMNNINSSASNKYLVSSKLPNINNLDKLKLAKKLSNSSSTTTIFKNYNKQSTNSASSTNSSLNFMHRKSGSTTNFHY
jgi:hypothetical protein